MDVSNSQLAPDQEQAAAKVLETDLAVAAAAQEVRSQNCSRSKEDRGRVQSAYRVKSFNSGPSAANAQGIGYSRTQVKTNNKTDDAKLK